MLGGIKGALSPAEGSSLWAVSGSRHVWWHCLPGKLWGAGFLSLSELHLNCLLSPFFFSAGELEASRNLLVK